MKRISAILLLIMYSAAMLGITVTRYYCCGSVRDVSVRFFDLEKKKAVCDKNGCCNQKRSFLKLQDNHEASFQVFGFHASQIISPDYHLNHICNHKQGFALYSRHLSNGPPDKLNISLAVLYCNFRI